MVSKTNEDISDKKIYQDYLDEYRKFKRFVDSKIDGFVKRNINEIVKNRIIQSLICSSGFNSLEQFISNEIQHKSSTYDTIIKTFGLNRFYISKLNYDSYLSS